jgi:hypothetical protein
MSDTGARPVLRPNEGAGEGGLRELETESAAPPTIENSVQVRLLSWSSLVIALLQSACTAVIAISGIRVAIGLTALAAAAGFDTPAKGFHSDAIRIPMMIVALGGSLLNLYLIWHIRRLRNRPAAQWRRVPLTARKLASERLQIVLSLFTLLLLAAEWITHPMIHRAH